MICYSAAAGIEAEQSSSEMMSVESRELTSRSADTRSCVLCSQYGDTPASAAVCSHFFVLDIKFPWFYSILCNREYPSSDICLKTKNYSCLCAVIFTHI